MVRFAAGSDLATSSRRKVHCLRFNSKLGFFSSRFRRFARDLCPTRERCASAKTSPMDILGNRRRSIPFKMTFVVELVLEIFQEACVWAMMSRSKQCRWPRCALQYLMGFGLTVTIFTLSRQPRVRLCQTITISISCTPSLACHTSPMLSTTFARLY